MKIIIAPDSFKGSLSAGQVASAIATGWQRACPDDEIVELPMADGGEGTLEAIVNGLNGQVVSVCAEDPLGRQIDARFGLIPPRKDPGSVHRPSTAVVEMASASGLGHVDPDPSIAATASSYGTGQVIAAALDLGVERLILGLGGSATSDGGAGMAQALGARLHDRVGQSVGRGGAALRDLVTIDLAHMHPRLARCEVLTATDVDIPLLGPLGAARIFGPQKGADAPTLAMLDAGLGRLAAVCADAGLGLFAQVPGAGAAGGLGFGAMVFLGSPPPSSGFDLVADILCLDTELTGAELVITGEGRLDMQSTRGKAPFGVLRRASARGVPVVAVAGDVSAGAEAAVQAGMTAVFSIVPGPCPLDDALAEAAENLSMTAEQIARMWMAARRTARDAPRPSS